MNVCKIFFGDCQLKLFEIAEALKISEGSVLTFLLDYMHRINFLAKGAPHINIETKAKSYHYQ